MCLLAIINFHFYYCSGHGMLRPFELRFSLSLITTLDSLIIGAIPLKPLNS